MILLKIIAVLLKLLGIILLLLLLAMCIPTRLGVTYKDTVIIHIQYLFFKYTFDSASLNEEKPEPEEKPKKPGLLKTVFTYLLGGVVWILRLIKRLLSAILKYIKTYSKRGIAGLKRFIKTHFKSKPKKKQKQTDDDEEDSPKEKKQQSLFGSLREDRGFWGAIGFFADLGKALGGGLVRIYRGVAIEKFMLRVSICGEDAADTAIQYGKVCSVAYPALSFLLTHARRYRQDIEITPDFAGNGAPITFDGEFILYPILILAHLLGAVFRFLISQVRYYTTRKLNEKKG
jgi:hypothetical protein